MYGLKSSDKKFDFDLEVDLKKHKHKKVELEQKIKKNIEDIKSYLKTKEAKHLKEYETILDGYESLQKVISKIK